MKNPKNLGIFDTLLQLPLLRGASKMRLSEIVGRFKLHFLKFTPGETVVVPGQECTSMMFLLNGSVRLTAQSADGELRVSQTLQAPQVISPDHLFGLMTQYPARVTAVDTVGIMEISKEEYRRMLAMDHVFLFNYLNAVCSLSQRSASGLLSIAAGSQTERLAYWLTTLTQPGATDIELTSDSRDLHQVLGMTAAALRTAAEHLGVALPDARTLRAPSRPTL